jgi:hypothetical protein
VLAGDTRATTAASRLPRTSIDLREPVASAVSCVALSCMVSRDLDRVDAKTAAREAERPAR